MKADIDYATSEAETTYGIIGVKVWVYKGDTLGTGVVIPATPPASEVEDDKKPRRAPRAPRRENAPTEEKPEVKAAVKRVRKVVKPEDAPKVGE